MVGAFMRSHNTYARKIDLQYIPISTASVNCYYGNFPFVKVKLIARSSLFKY